MVTVDSVAQALTTKELTMLDLLEYTDEYNLLSQETADVQLIVTEYGIDTHIVGAEHGDSTCTVTNNYNYWNELPVCEWS